MQFGIDGEVIAENQSDLGEAHVLLGRFNGSGYHTLPPKLRYYPHELNTSAGALIRRTLKERYGDDMMNQNYANLWSLAIQDQRDINEDPA